MTGVVKLTKEVQPIEILFYQRNDKTFEEIRILLKNELNQKINPTRKPAKFKVFNGFKDF